MLKHSHHVRVQPHGLVQLGVVAGLVLVRLFENPALVERRRLAFAAWGIPPG